MQQMIEKLVLRGYTYVEACGLITYFRGKPVSECANVETFIDQLCRVLDEYKKVHGEYVKLVMS